MFLLQYCPATLHVCLLLVVVRMATKSSVAAAVIV